MLNCFKTNSIVILKAHVLCMCYSNLLLMRKCSLIIEQTRTLFPIHHWNLVDCTLPKICVAFKNDTCLVATISPYLRPIENQFWNHDTLGIWGTHGFHVLQPFQLMAPLLIATMVVEIQ